MEQYFQDHKDNSIDNLLDKIRMIHTEVNSFVVPELPRIPGLKIESYGDKLSELCLSENETPLEDVVKYISELFKGALRWNHPGTMINITPPATLGSMALSAYSMLFNPNGAQDLSTGGLLFSELETTKYLADLVAWEWKNAHGTFTFGGKATNLYAAKIALNSALPSSWKSGNEQQCFFISSEQGHPCHSEACDWIGIGYDNCIRVPVDENGEMIISEAEKIIQKNIEEGKIFLGIFANGGTTIQIVIDPIKELFELINRIVKKYELKHRPILHVDSVIGWLWLFFKDYNYDENGLQIERNILSKILAMSKKIEQIKYADSFGVDFHKSGFTPYVSSIFMINDRKKIFNLGRKQAPNIDQMSYGDYGPFQYTLELSRSLNGPLSALLNLRMFGKQGYRKSLVKLMEASIDFKNKLEQREDFEVVNHNTQGFVTLFIIKPKYSCVKYREYIYSSEDVANEIAQYNYKFYLYLLNLEYKGKINFTIDYSSGYEKIENGYKFGVLKSYPMSPLATVETTDCIIKNIRDAKDSYDKNIEGLSLNYNEMPYKPRSLLCKKNSGISIIHPIESFVINSKN